MNDDRRVVRVAASFFRDLDNQLPAERGPNGEPSTRDFQVHELLRIVDRFAVEFDHLPELIAGRSDYRILYVVGILVPRYFVIGQLAPDGGIELIRLSVDLDASW